MAEHLQDLHNNWEALAEDDPLWAVLTDPQLRGRAWGLDEFLASGESEIDKVLKWVAYLAAPKWELPALDFGCGAGRLTQALGRRFVHADGIDISEAMLRTARELNREGDRARFHLNQLPTLPFKDDSYGFVYSNVVLQHMHPDLALGYVREFMRVTVPGGLVVFQVPDSRIPPRVADWVRDVVGSIRRKLAVGTRIRQRRVRIERDPGPAGTMEMHAIPEARIRQEIEAVDGRILNSVLTNSADVDFNGDLQYLGHKPERGWVSKQYTVTL
jgi:SAM-dependent methyltransferase